MNYWSNHKIWFTWYPHGNVPTFLKLDLWSLWVGFINIISTKGINQIKKGKLYEKSKFYAYKKWVQSLCYGCNSTSTIKFLCTKQKSGVGKKWSIKRSVVELTQLNGCFQMQSKYIGSKKPVPLIYSHLFK